MMKRKIPPASFIIPQAKYMAQAFICHSEAEEILDLGSDPSGVGDQPVPGCANMSIRVNMESRNVAEYSSIP